MKGTSGPSCSRLRSTSADQRWTSRVRMRRRSSGGIGGFRLAASSQRRALEARQLELRLVGFAERHDARQELRPAPPRSASSAISARVARRVGT